MLFCSDLQKSYYLNRLQTLMLLFHYIELNLTIPTTLHSPSYLFWKARYGTCRFFVYTLLLDDNFDSKYILYLVRKVFSRRIQRRRLRGMGPSILRENRQLSDRPLSDQIKHIATFLIQPLLSGLPPLCIGHSPSVLHRFGWCLACFGGRNVGWNGPVGLSFPCKRLLIVESLNIIACDWQFFLYTMYYHLCTVAPARRDSVPLLFFTQKPSHD